MMKEIENLSRLIKSKEIESQIKISQKRESPGPNRWFHWRILLNILKRINVNPSPTLPKHWGGGNISQLILWCQGYQNEIHHKKRSLQTNILDEYSSKNHQYQKTEFNSMLEGLYTMPKKDLSLECKIIQHMKINNCNIPHQQYERKKSYDHLSW